jgi:hypothetical protein
MHSKEHQGHEFEPNYHRDDASHLCLSFTCKTYSWQPEISPPATTQHWSHSSQVPPSRHLRMCFALLLRPLERWLPWLPLQLRLSFKLWLRSRILQPRRPPIRIYYSLRQHPPLKTFKHGQETRKSRRKRTQNKTLLLLMMMASVLVNQSLLSSSLSRENSAKRIKQDNFLSLDSTLNSIIKRLETLISAMIPNP